MRVKDIFGGIPILYMYIVYLYPIRQSISLYIIIIINLLFISYYTLLLEVGYPSGYILLLYMFVVNYINMSVFVMLYDFSIVYI